MPTHVYLGTSFSLRARVDHFDEMPAKATLGELIELSIEVEVLEHGKDPYIRSKGERVATEAELHEVRALQAQGPSEGQPSPTARIKPTTQKASKAKTRSPAMV